MKKTFLTHFLVISLLFSLFGAVTALADEENTYSYGNIKLKYRIENENAVITGIETYEADVEIPNAIGEYTVTELDCKFNGCTYLMNLKLPDSITEIKAGAFEYCKNLKTFNIPQGVKHIRAFTFGHCTNLEKVTIPKNVTYIDVDAFVCCTNLTDVTFSEGLEYIAFQAFYDCTALKNIEIPAGVDFIHVTAFEKTQYCSNESNWADGCLYINSYLLATKQNLEGKYVIKSGTTYIADNAFQNTPKLTGIVIPESMKRIQPNAFQNCYGLINITLPDNIEYIGDHAFENTAYYNDESKWKNGILYLGNYIIGVKENESGIYNIAYGTKFVGNEFKDLYTSVKNFIPVKAVKIPETISAVSELAFVNCTSMESVYLPKSLTKIEKNAFGGCRELKTVYYGGTKEEWDKIEIEEENEYLKNATVVFSHRNIWADVSENGLKFSVVPVNIEKNTEIILALYNGNKLVETQTKKYNGENISFTTDKFYTTAKIMCWENLTSLTPLCEACTVMR